MSRPARLTPGRAVRAEWLKFATLTANPVAASAALLMIVALAGVLVWARSGEPAQPTMVELLNGVSWAQLLVAVLAAVFICSEWSSGTGVVTFLAAPTRWPVLLGKVSVMGTVAFLIGVIGASGALLVGAGGGVDPGTDPALAVRLVVGSGVYLAGLAVIAVGIGAVVRNLVAGILTVLGFLWLFPLAVTMIPSPQVQRLVAYLPSPAGGVLIAAENPTALLTPWAGAAVLLTWAGAAVLAAVIALRASDV